MARDTNSNRSNGIICNFDPIGDVLTTTNQYKIYLWVMNVSTSTTETLFINGCSDNANYNCPKDISNFSTSIASISIPASTLKVITLELKNPSIDTVDVKINSTDYVKI